MKPIGMPVSPWHVPALRGDGEGRRAGSRDRRRNRIFDHSCHLAQAFLHGSCRIPVSTAAEGSPSAARAPREEAHQLARRGAGTWPPGAEGRPRPWAIMACTSAPPLVLELGEWRCVDGQWTARLPPPVSCRGFRPLAGKMSPWAIGGSPPEVWISSERMGIGPARPASTCADYFAADPRQIRPSASKAAAQRPEGDRANGCQVRKPAVTANRFHMPEHEDRRWPRKAQAMVLAESGPRNRDPRSR